MIWSDFRVCVRAVLQGDLGSRAMYLFLGPRMGLRVLRVAVRCMDGC